MVLIPVKYVTITNRCQYVSLCVMLSVSTMHNVVLASSQGHLYAL